METLLRELWDLRAEAVRRGDDFQRRKSLPAGDRRDAFAIIFNTATMTLELLNFYYHEWGKPRPGLSPTEVERSRKQNGERVMLALKLLFISSLSGIEFSAKQTLQAMPASPLSNALQARGRRLYLGGIMQETERLGLVPTGFRAAWDPMIEIRNTLVHNNGIADQSQSYTIRGEAITLAPGKMTQSRPRFFLVMVSEAMSLYDIWSNAV